MVTTTTAAEDVAATWPAEQAEEALRRIVTVILGRRVGTYRKRADPVVAMQRYLSDWYGVTVADVNELQRCLAAALAEQTGAVQPDT